MKQDDVVEAVQQAVNDQEGALSIDGDKGAWLTYDGAKAAVEAALSVKHSDLADELLAMPNNEIGQWLLSRLGIMPARQQGKSLIGATFRDIITALRSDITRHVAITAEQANELETLRARVKELEGALELAENRLRRRALDFDPTTPLAYETREWADEARQALKGDKQS